MPNWCTNRWDIWAPTPERAKEVFDAITKNEDGKTVFTFTTLLPRPPVLERITTGGNLMSRAGPMLPKHCQDLPAICLAVTMRALQWGFDPFGLAMELFQAKDGGPVGYQAKVFVSALSQCTGIRLQYRFEGEYELSDKPALSGKGNTVAPRAAKGDRRCIAYWTDENGEVLEVATPKLDDIGIKNSALWHNNPDQQLAYYAGRDWVRRYRPEVMLGAYSADEVAAMQAAPRDVTPKETGFARLAREAKEKAEQAQAADETPADNEAEAEETAEGEIEQLPLSVEAVEQMMADRAAGANAAAEGFARSDCPHKDDPERAKFWLEGWDSVGGETA